ncbi:pyridoxal-phosphate dependent enzyme [Nonomuraea sp. NPDC050328]|uniref:pyridoxal-phosphate dependent enzyme n=1 Tax=Nonomuraea sp. NPDC050328 TaxID=3364361 RepID=UPI0037964DD6
MRDSDDALLPIAGTPLHRLPGLAGELGLSDLWVKREDLTGLAGGGNKARKLAALVAEARRQGCDHLVTGGGAQSNHARMTAAAANVAGLGCDLVLTRLAAEPVASGNVLLDEVLGARVRWLVGAALPYEELEEAIRARARELAEQGRKPYALPIGGSSPEGVACYAEVARELDEALRPDLVVVASGSGGTHAGLVAGLGEHARVLGVDVGARPDLARAVEELAAQVAARTGRPEPTGRCALDTGRIGAGYGEPTGPALEALLLAARTDGLLLDPVYTAKAMAGLVAAAREGRIARGDRVVFLHTGGLPGLFATRYAGWLTTSTPAGGATGSGAGAATS